jgi:hypothetical protein
VRYLPKPDLLHTIQISILHHVQKWIIHIMKTPERLQKYNAIGLSVPARHDLTIDTSATTLVSV